MAIIKILIESDETQEEVEEALVKAIGEKHDMKAMNLRFDDQLMNHLSDRADKIYIDNYQEMMKRILDVIKE